MTDLRTLSLSVFLIASTCASLSPAHAHPGETLCKDRGEAVTGLSRRYKEAPIASGYNPETQHIIELWASPDGSTFTITSTDAEGVTCYVSSGVMLTHKEHPQAPGARL